jgi:hypothetical protein
VLHHQPAQHPKTKEPSEEQDMERTLIKVAAHTYEIYEDGVTARFMAVSDSAAEEWVDLPITVWGEEE